MDARTKHLYQMNFSRSEKNKTLLGIYQQNLDYLPKYQQKWHIYI